MRRTRVPTPTFRKPLPITFTRRQVLRFLNLPCVLVRVSPVHPYRKGTLVRAGYLSDYVRMKQMCAASLFLHNTSKYSGRKIPKNDRYLSRKIIPVLLRNLFPNPRPKLDLKHLQKLRQDHRRKNLRKVAPNHRYLSARRRQKSRYLIRKRLQKPRYISQKPRYLTGRKLDEVNNSANVTLLLATRKVKIGTASKFLISGFLPRMRFQSSKYASLFRGLKSHAT